MSRPAFVGRLDEVRRLDGMVSEAQAGRGAVALVTGDAGIGKSALVAEVAALAAARGTAVVWGLTRDAEGAPAFWPWSQILRACAPLLDGPVAGVPPRGLDLLERLAPGLTRRDASHTVTDDLDDTARFELAAATIEVLRQVGRGNPLLTVLEDLHAADEASIRLLALVAPRLADLRVLMLATYRDRELSDDARLILGGLGGEPARLELEGLGRDEIGLLVTAVATTAVHPSMADGIAALTGGNPLFAREVTRLLGTKGLLARPLAPGELVPVPSEIRQVIRARTTPLPEPVAEIVQTAAVMGTDFDVATLHRVTGLAVERVLEHLEVAGADGLVEEIPATVGRYRFTHVLQRSVVYEGLPASVRVELHRRVAAALERLHAADLGPHLSELSYHLHACAVVSDPDHVLGITRRAGDRALRLLAFQEAAVHYRRALDALEASGAHGPDVRCDLLLSLADAERRGGADTARATCRRAAELARDAGDPERLARAALVMQTGIGMVGARPAVDEELVRVLEEALAALSEDDHPIRAEVLALLAEELYWTGDLERTGDLSASAVDMARRLGDDKVLARALVGRHYAIWGPDTLDEREALAGEILVLARRVRNPELAFMGHAFRLACHLERGDRLGFEAEVKAVEAISDDLRQPIVRWALLRWGATRALIEGRLDDAERLIGEAATVAQEVQDPEAVMQYVGIQMWQLLHERGALGDLEPAMRELAQAHPHLPSYRTALVFLWTLMGRSAEARSEIDRFFAGGLDQIPRDMSWHTSVNLLARSCAGLGDGQRCAELHDLTSPYADRCVIVGDGTLYGGAVAHWSALAAQVAGRLDDAEVLFEQAMSVNHRLGARPFLAHTATDYARMLEQRDAPGDRGRADALLEQAAGLYRACGMDAFSPSGEVGAEAPPEPAGHARLVARRARLRRDGDTWVVGLDGEEARLADLRGLHHLALLIDRPGVEVHVLEMSSPGGRATTRHDDGLTAANADAGPILDDRAKRAYRDRLAELQDDLEEAEAHHDPERAARAREEMDALTEQLASAVGLGGRDRRAGADAERARVSVTKAIRNAIARIDAHVPVLAGHLRVSVRTGTFCCYEPDPSAGVTWDLR